MTVFWTRHLVYPLYERITGRRVLSKLRELERAQWLPQSQIQARSRERLRDLLVHAYRQVPFYRRRIDVLGYAPEALAEPELFGQLPLLTKQDIIEHRDEMVARDFPRSELRPNATGGSTGHMLSFYNDRASLDFRSAITIRGDRWAGLDIGTPHARLWGAPLEIQAQEQLVNRWTNLALHRLWLDCFRLSDDLLAEYVRKLQRFRPRVLVGYATALATMAQYVMVRDVKDIHLESVVSSAETLFEEQRRQIKDAFGCQVYDRYGCREAGPIAAECPEGRMHVNADSIYVEILRGGQPAQPGELGEIVLTPLHGYGMPLIRYRVGDLGIAAPQVPCPCGRGLPVIERVIGRTSDMFVNARGDMFHGEYFTHLFYNQPGIRQFQVVQPDLACLIFKVVTDQSFDTGLLEHIQERVIDFVGPLDVQWQIVDEIPSLKSGKRSFTISHVGAVTAMGSKDGNTNA
jgi:phenylacetate-CoA ligase